MTLLVLIGCTIAPDALPLGSTAEDCGACHVSHFDEWASSSHGQSAASPVFSALLPRVEAAWGAQARDTCAGCHAPGHGGDAAIGCVACHAAVGNHATRDGQLAVDLSAPLAGPLGAATVATDAHTSAPRALLTDAVLCGTCHEVTAPEILEERTFSEHEAEGAQETCVDCHAQPVGQRPLVEGGGARASRDHGFVGFDPPWDDPGDPDAAAATQALLARALSLQVEVAADGSRDVVVTNVGATHHVPTGAAFLRDIWVEVDGVRVLSLGDQPTRAGAPVALLTDADAITERSLAPGESVRAALPRGASRVALLGRALRPDVEDALELRIALPTHTIAAVGLDAAW